MERCKSKIEDDKAKLKAAEAKLQEAAELAKNETVSCPAVKERRFAMVFSVPEQKIVLAAEVKGCLSSSSK